MAVRLSLICLAVSLPLLADMASVAAQGGNEIQNQIGMRLVYIAPGTFTMGVSKEPREDDAKDKTERDLTLRVDEDAHLEEITQGFYMGKYEVTQAEYKEVMGKGNNPSHFQGDKLPVERVSWYEAKDFCRKLSAREGKNYTLPTEAEWEYACRAKTTSAFNFGTVITSDKANYDARKPFPPNQGQRGQFRDKTTPVGSFAPNAWGLHDMHGNVWEWCEDWHAITFYRPSSSKAPVPVKDPKGPDAGRSRVLRGGSWFYEPEFCRSAYRTGFRPDMRSHNIGFRVVLRATKGA